MPDQPTVAAAEQSRNWPALLNRLLTGESLSSADAGWAMTQIMTGEATPVQVAGFAVALRAKGETAEEVHGLVDAMLQQAARIELSGPAVDTCGTGGDRAHTVNISTLAALVARAAGVTVVKHGNRAASSACGSADLLQELGVVVDLPPRAVQRCVDELGLGFCFAPVFHPALRHAALPRRELGVPTVFNYLGPLTNPAQPTAQLLGVADNRMAPVLAGVLARRGRSALVVHGDDGLDELTTTAASQVWAVCGSEVTSCRLELTDVGLSAATREQLTGGDAAHNAGVAHRLLGGERGAVRDAVLYNAAGALVACAGPDPGRLPGQLREQLDRAAAALDSGKAAQLLERWVTLTRRLASDQASS